MKKQLPDVRARLRIISISMSLKKNSFMIASFLFNAPTSGVSPAGAGWFKFQRADME